MCSPFFPSRMELMDLTELMDNVFPFFPLLAVAVSPDNITVATSQAGTRPCILLWDTKAMTLRKKLTGLHRDVVRHLRFAPPDGTRLLSVGQDYDHTIGNCALVFFQFSFVQFFPVFPSMHQYICPIQSTKYL